MKLLLIILVLLPELLAAPPDDNHAQFHWVDCPEDNNADQCLKVVYPGDKTEDMAHLNYVDGEVTILSGFLMNEQGTAISVTVYEDHMEITMHSSHDDGHSMFTVDMATGATSIVEMPTDITFDDGAFVPGGYSPNTTANNDYGKRDITRRFVPTNGYNLRVAVFYDTAFQNFAGGSTAAATKISAIFNHVKTIFTQFSVSGVSGAIVPTLHSTNYRSGYWSADNYLSTCSYISNGLQWDVDEHVYITYQNSASGIVGMAWLGTTCSIYQYYRSNINEWYQSDTITAQIVAHEIGHNLGMYHDFTNSRGNRYYNGQACTNIGGYMDYTTAPTRWSPCSVGDFTSYYSYINSQRPNDGNRPSSPFCLQESTTPSTAAPDTCVTTCVAAWTGAASTCVKTHACTQACTAGTCS